MSNGDALGMFVMLFVPACFFGWLEVGRDLILGYDSEPNHPVRGAIAVAVIAGGVYYIGFPLAVALALPLGPATGVGTGRWLAGGGTVVIKHRASRLFAWAHRGGRGGGSPGSRPEDWL